MKVPLTFAFLIIPYFSCFAEITGYWNFNYSLKATIGENLEWAWEQGDAAFGTTDTFFYSSSQVVCASSLVTEELFGWFAAAAVVDVPRWPIDSNVTILLLSADSPEIIYSFFTVVVFCSGSLHVDRRSGRCSISDDDDDVLRGGSTLVFRWSTESRIRL